MTTVNERVAALRELMKREHLAAFIFPSTDPHQGEYVPEHWRGRAWISGFNGSAGVAVVTQHKAALWTDSRYFIAAEEQLAGTDFQLMKLRVAGTPSVAEWLSTVLADEPEKEVGIDGGVNARAFVEQLAGELRKQGGLTLRTNLDPLATLWKDRPALPADAVTIQPLAYAGERTGEKIARIRQALRAQHAEGMLMTPLDDIAWTLNLRGSDVACNPVFVAYLLIAPKKCTLFVAPEKLTDEVKAYLADEGVDTQPYTALADGLARYDGYNLLMDAGQVSYTVSQWAKGYGTVWGQSPVGAMKAVKNEAEIAGFRKAMVRDGVAMVKFLKWLKPAVEQGGQTELSVTRKLAELRAGQPLFRDISFDTIAGYEAHGAIVHYEATPETDVVLEPHGLLLLDSGAQYCDGTTDITRTIALGPVTEEQKRIYTLVLKAHIGLDKAKFPDGATGTQIDALCRSALWQEGLNYGHGTGHGVGSYLCVHEGPHQVRQEYVAAPLHAGMTVTNEPGIYLAGRFGVRTENVLLITPYQETECGRFLQMEALTLCPIDTAPLLPELLSAEEREWLNAYHNRVFLTLSPHLDTDEKAWLAMATRAI